MSPLNKREFNYIVKQIRRVFVWSEKYRKTKARCRIAPDTYKCEGCERIICTTEKAYDTLILTGSEASLEKVAVDHIDAVGTLTTLDEAAARIFCDETGLQILCFFCHFSKTMVDQEEIRNKRKLSLVERIEENDLE